MYKYNSTFLISYYVCLFQLCFIIMAKPVILKLNNKVLILGLESNMDLVLLDGLSKNIAGKKHMSLLENFHSYTNLTSASLTMFE